MRRLVTVAFRRRRAETTSPPPPAKMCYALRRCNFLYEMLTGLHMLDPWERVAFNSTLLALLSIIAYFFLGPSAAATPIG